VIWAGSIRRVIATSSVDRRQRDILARAATKQADRTILRATVAELLTRAEWTSG